jgi:hypothetical protein
MKVDLEDIQLALSQHGVEQKLAQQIINDVKQAAEDAKGGNGPAKKTKYKYLIVASDPDGTKKTLIENTPMWVFKVPDEEKHTDVLPRFYKGVYDFNAKSRKGRKNPVKTVGDGIQAVGSKHFKPNKTPILTKEPVIVLVTDNKIPTA